MKKITVVENIIYAYCYIVIFIPIKIINYITPSKIYPVHLLILKRIKQFFPKTFETNNLHFDTQELANIDRGRTLHTKEPDTINWINNFISKGDIFYDIGANIGIYSLFTAKHKDAKCYAFEPESSNYFYLNRNILHNNLDNKIQAFNLALNDTSEVSSLLLDNLIIGSSGHSFISHELLTSTTNIHSPFKQGALGISLDELVYNIGGVDFPNHIKIDVDGNEYKIIRGMSKILKDSRLRTIAIEIDLNIDDNKTLIDHILSHGFQLIEGKEYTNKEYDELNIPNVFFKRI